MVRRGFSLAELMIAIFSAALLSLSLFQLLQQTRKVVRRVVNVIEVDEPLAAWYLQLEKDVVGMFPPQGAIEAYAQEDKKKAEEAKKAASKSPQEEKTEEKKQEVTEEQVVLRPVMAFEAEKNSVYWSFITTGGIQHLTAQGTVEPAPFVRRVAYILEPDPQRPSLRRLLYRFSNDKLGADDLKGSNAAPSYELLPGIKSIEFEFTVIEYVEKKPGTPAPTTPPPSSILKEWNEQEVWNRFKALIPAYVRVSGVVVDVTEKEYPFERFIKVPAYAPYTPKEETLAERIERVAADIFGKKP